MSTTDEKINRMRYARERKGYSLNYVAEKMNTTKMSVSRWERGLVKALPKETILELAELYKVDPSWLLGDDVPMIKSEMPEDISQAELISLFSRISPENQKLYLALLRSLPQE